MSLHSRQNKIDCEFEHFAIQRPQESKDAAFPSIGNNIF